MISRIIALGNQIATAELVLDGTKFGQFVVKFGNNEKKVYKKSRCRFKWVMAAGKSHCFNYIRRMVYKQ
ncbi:hypothetical protein DWY91_18430 [Enterocloster bolteae]|uniref:Uncharacterized protein n=1 Tax=Enterocloster bolteae TaxID=208479 RepID=A0A412Z4C2_9FIRM|nr:hypothetical protein DWY91_18430 [Enterocloster bolteae]RGV74806.1 hypothetical protein DWW02_15825 [Enterocloster bolteae]DAZ82693.1 MAG TPA: hypothetical protein [Caudoviricetes sp.]